MHDRWDKVQLGDVATFLSGGTPRKDEDSYWGGDIPWISGATLTDRRLHSSERRLTSLGVENGSRIAPAGATLILVRGMSLLEEIRIGQAMRDLAFNQDVKALVPAPGIDAGFLTYALLARRPELLRMVHQAGHGTGVLATDLLRALWIMLPPTKEQRRIAGVLGALDDLIDTNHKISGDLEHLLAAKFALAGFDEPSNDGHRLADFISINPPCQKPRTDAPYIDMAALPTDRARVASVVRRTPSGGARFRNGDTVMARITPCLENGKTAYIDLLGPGEVGIGSTEFIVLRSAGMLGHHWSYFLARSPRFREYAVQNMSGTSGRQRCPADAIERYSIATPDHAAASSFADLAEVLFEAIKKFDDEAHQAARTRDELLPLLLSERVRVEDVAA